MLKVLLLNCPYGEIVLRDNYCCHTSKVHYLWPPVDLLGISGALEKRNISYECIDAIAEEVSWETVFSFVYENNITDVIALTGTTTFLEDIASLRKIKSEKKTLRIFLMGNRVAFTPNDVMIRYAEVDGIFHHFFDNSVADFLLGEPSEYPGISYRNKDGIVDGKINYTRDRYVETHPPDFSKFPLHAYRTPLSKRTPIGASLLSFGCPYTCKFCTASEINLMFKTIESVECEFEAMRRAGVKEIFFQDSTFNANISYVQQVCELLQKHDFTWTCDIHHKNTDLSVLQMMRDSGCHGVQIGVESFKQESLNEFAPSKSDRQKTKQAFENCKTVGLQTLGYFIVGLNNEGENDMNNTINWAIELNPTFASFATLAPDFGTKYYREVMSDSENHDKFHYFPTDNSGKPMAINKLETPDLRNKMLVKAYLRFYFRPAKMMEHFFKFKNWENLWLNGYHLLRKKLG